MKLLNAPAALSNARTGEHSDKRFSLEIAEPFVGSALVNGRDGQKREKHCRWGLYLQRLQQLKETVHLIAFMAVLNRVSKQPFPIVCAVTDFYLRADHASNNGREVMPLFTVNNHVV